MTARRHESGADLLAAQSPARSVNEDMQDLDRTHRAPLSIDIVGEVLLLRQQVTRLQSSHDHMQAQLTAERSARVGVEEQLRTCQAHLSDLTRFFGTGCASKYSDRATDKWGNIDNVNRSADTFAVLQDGNTQEHFEFPPTLRLSEIRAPLTPPAPPGRHAIQQSHTVRISDVLAPSPRALKLRDARGSCKRDTSPGCSQLPPTLLETEVLERVSVLPGAPPPLDCSAATISLDLVASLDRISLMSPESSVAQKSNMSIATAAGSACSLGVGRSVPAGDFQTDPIVDSGSGTIDGSAAAALFHGGIVEVEITEKLQAMETRWQNMKIESAVLRSRLQESDVQQYRQGERGGEGGDLPHGYRWKS